MIFTNLKIKFRIRFGIIYAISALFSMGVLVPCYKTILHEEMNASEIGILSAIDVYSEFLKHTRAITERYDVLLENSSTDEIKHDGHYFLESLMLHSSFAFNYEYLILRSINGASRIEIKRGAINRNKSNFRISGEEKFSNLSDVFLTRGCTIDGAKYFCLIDIPDPTKFTSPELRTYTAIALTIPEILLHIQYRDPRLRWQFFSPIIKLQIDNFIAKLSSIGGEISFLKSTRHISDGVNIEAGFPISNFIFSVLTLAFLLAVIISTLFYLLEARFRKRLQLQREVENAILKEKQQSLDSIEKLIQGVIHDIRSPLVVLNFLAKSATDDNSKKNLKLLAQRMQLIINDLETKQRQSADAKPSLLPLRTLLKLLLKEKLNEFSDSINIIFEEPNQEFWFKGSFSETFRVLSNIINNAKQASRRKDRIWISINDLENNGFQIAIRDEGKGISPEIEDCIFQDGATFGKADGSGFGLYHAKLTIEKAGGQISFISRQNEGTTFYINLPKQKDPAWAVQNINLANAEMLVVIDDEKSYFEIWQTLCVSSGKPICYFAHPDDVPINILLNDKALKVIDNNFGKEMGKGIHFINQYSIQNCILMTSDWFLPEVQHFASLQGIKLLGKEFLDEICITCENFQVIKTEI